MGEDVNISDAEWVVMDALWLLGRGTAAEIIAELAGATDWNHRTIRTLLGRLVSKGYVERIEQPGGSRYRPLLRRSDGIRREGRSFLQRVFRGDAHSLLLHFAREARLEPDKLRQLRDLLEDNPSE